jgi:hypothetical protein
VGEDAHRARPDDPLPALRRAPGVGAVIGPDAIAATGRHAHARPANSSSRYPAV